MSGVAGVPGSDSPTMTVGTNPTSAAVATAITLMTPTDLRSTGDRRMRSIPRFRAVGRRRFTHTSDGKAAL
jgi:hypothetical protein